MNKQNIVLVTGMSGAGKTTAIGILEDMGYHCIDQFPVQLIHELGKIIRDEHDPRYANLALATTAMDYEQFLEYFENREIPVRVMFLDASDEKLLRRYKFTRRNHPFIVFNKANTLEEAIESERDMFDNLKYRNVVHIDTTMLTQKTLKESIERKFAVAELSPFTISFVSFGYKHGVPMDADLMFDVRFLPNPYYIEELKELTGDDRPVYEYVMNCEETKVLINHLVSMLDYLFKQYEKEGKNHLTVAIGCTGGQHRSVSITNYLYEHYQTKYHCHKGHRDKKVR